MPRKIRFILLLTFVAAIAGCRGKSDTMTASGSFEAETYLITPEGAGKLLSWQAPQGISVKKGQSLGQIDTVLLFLQRQAALDQAAAIESAIPNANAQLGPILKQIEVLERERNRVKRLVEANAVGKKQLDDINSQIEILEERVASIRSTLSKSSQQLLSQSSAMRAKATVFSEQIMRSQLYAPISGTVLETYLKPGELAAPGRPIAKIGNLQNMVLRAYMPYEMITEARIGDSVKVLIDVDEKSQKEYKGRLAWISDEAEFTPKSAQTQSERNKQVYAAKIFVPNDGTIKMGMYGQVVIKRRAK